jgi:T5orf172 domain
MATLPGQRASFTWALNQYKLAEDDEDKKEHFTKLMAKYIANAPSNGFTVEQVTQGQLYPDAEVAQYIKNPTLSAEPGITEGEALEQISHAVDTSDIVKLGEGPKAIYAYGYKCAPDRLKIGLTEGDVVQRIAAQISTSTPDKPILFLEIRTHDCASLEKVIHATLAYRGRKIDGGGTEWYKTSREEIVIIYQSVAKLP